MKYVVFKIEISDTLARLEPVIFGDALVHAEVARYFAACAVRAHGWRSAAPVSAGYVEFGPDGVMCHGRSETLKMDSRGEEDARLIEFADYGVGYL